MVSLKKIIIIILFLSACHSPKEMTKSNRSSPLFYITGHRGARGLMPESTIPAMIKGIKVGANTLETDLQITEDGKVVLNHDYTFNPYYVTNPDGSDIPHLPDMKRANNSYIPEQEQDKYAIYKLNYAEIRKFIVGLKYFAQFPEQERVKTYMPLLSEMIDSVEEFTQKHQTTPVYYMPEIKSDPKYYGSFQPYPEVFVKIVMDALKPYLPKIKNRLIIQCSDMEPLRILHREYPNIKLALLPKKKNIPIADRIKKLGFKPDFFLPYYPYAKKKLIEDCHALDIKVIPWTPDNSIKIRNLILKNVDGIITNYPDRLKRVINSMKNLPEWENRK